MYIRCTVESVAIVFDELVDYGKVTDHVSIFFRYTEYSYKDLQKKDRIKIPLPKCSTNNSRCTPHIRLAPE